MKAKHHTNFQPDRVFSYFLKEWKVLLAVAISGLIYNIGLLAGPWFEGKMTGCLVDILKGADQFSDMLVLVLGYVTAIAIVQTARYIKRFYVRRFCQQCKSRMKVILYASLVRKSRVSLREEGEGSIMTKAILDVDDCVEGMRKFTTEIFDTGVALGAYAGMLLWYDFRLALLCMIFSADFLYDGGEDEKDDPENWRCIQRAVRIFKYSYSGPGRNAITYRDFWM